MFGKLLLVAAAGTVGWYFGHQGIKNTQQERVIIMDNTNPATNDSFPDSPVFRHELPAWTVLPKTKLANILARHAGRVYCVLFGPIPALRKAVAADLSLEYLVVHATWPSPDAVAAPVRPAAPSGLADYYVPPSASAVDAIIVVDRYGHRENDIFIRSVGVIVKFYARDIPRHLFVQPTTAPVPSPNGVYAAFAQHRPAGVDESVVPSFFVDTCPTFEEHRIRAGARDLSFECYSQGANLEFGARDATGFHAKMFPAVHAALAYYLKPEPDGRIPVGRLEAKLLNILFEVHASDWYMGWADFFQTAGLDADKLRGQP